MSIDKSLIRLLDNIHSDNIGFLQRLSGRLFILLYIQIIVQCIPGRVDL